MAVNLISALFLCTAFVICSGDKKTDVISNLVPFEHFVGTDREGETGTLAERMVHWSVPGISIAVIKDHTVDWADGFGFAQPGVNANSDTVYQAGTMSSFISALATLKLVENGTLNLDTNINDYLTSWKMKYKRGKDVEQNDDVKLKYLLGHCGSVNVLEFDGYAQGQTLPTLLQTLNKQGPATNDKVQVMADVLDVIFEDPIKPGSEEIYSAGGYAALQQLLQDKMGMDFTSIAQQLVFDKAGLSSASTFDIRQSSAREGVAFGYECINSTTNKESTITGNWNNYPESAAQGLWTNVNDLAKLAINVAQGKGANPNSILNPATTTKLLSVVMKNGVAGAEEDGTFGPGTEVIDSTGDNKWFANTGYSEGYCSEMIGNTDGRGLVMMANQNCETAHFLLGEVFRSVVETYQWRDARTVDVPFNSRLAAKLPLSSPQPWEGTYKVDPVDVGIPGVDPIDLGFKNLYVAADHIQPSEGSCSIRMYPCADKTDKYCPELGIFQKALGEEIGSGDRLGEIIFKEEGGDYTGEFYIGTIPIIRTELKVIFKRIASSTGATRPAGSTRSTMSRASTRTRPIFRWSTSGMPAGNTTTQKSTSKANVMQTSIVLGLLALATVLILH